jgi:Transposase DDE domain
VRVRVAHRDYRLSESRSEEWLLIEWPKGEKEPTKHWLSNLPEDISCQRPVDCAKLRWRIEHDYKELKQEVGLGDFEGRGWRGFHHHATMSIAVYGFLISERGVSPLSSYCQSSLPAICPSQELPTPRLHRSGLSVTSRIPSPPCADGSSQSSSPSSHAARAVEQRQRDAHASIYDAVLLGAPTILSLVARTACYALLGKGSGRQGWESSGVQVPVPSIACVQAVSISGACGGNKAR